MRTMILAAIAILAVSCETESLVVKNAPQDNLSANPILKENVLRLTQHPTAIDNLIDGTDCFSISFPYSIWANGQQVLIQSASDYQQVRDIFDANSSDTDTVTPIYPIRIRYADYNESVLQTASDFEIAKFNCLQSKELSCMNLEFPITIKWFEWQNQREGTLESRDAKTLYGFVSRLSPETVASFDYPLQIVTPDATVTITTNDGFEQVIGTYIENCSPTEPEPVNPDLVLEDVLATGNWYVSYFFREIEQTDDYTPYDFTFNSDGTSSVTGEPSPIAGTWVTFMEDGEKHIVFVFSSSQLEELEESWIVDDFSQSSVQMRYESGGSGTRYFNLTRN